MNNIPRRIQLEQNTPAELAIRKAIEKVEKMGADIRLTHAVLCLDSALNSVSDYVDGVISSTNQ